MISLQFNPPTNTRPTSQYTNYVPMMTRYCTGKHLPRPPYTDRPKRLTIWNNPVHLIRSFLLYWFLLSFLPLKPSPNPRTWGMLTTHRYQSPKPSGGSTPKYICPPGFRRINHLSPPQPNGRKPQKHTASPTHHNLTRGLLYTTPSFRILRNPLYNCRWGVRIYILHGHWIPRSTCHYWIYFPPSMLYATTKIPLHLQAPFRFRSRRLILTLRRRSMTILIRLYLLMRLLPF